MDISTTYLGFELRSPFIAGAGPMADSIDMVRALEDAGCGAIVMRSLFEEQLSREGLATHHSMDSPAHSFAEAMTYFAEPEGFVLGPDAYLEHVRALKEAVDIPIIASLNGSTPGGWLNYAKLMEEAGADAIELHIYNVPTEPEVSGEAVEQSAIDIVKSVKESIKLPIAAKLSPFYTSIAHLAKRLDEAGANGLVLFNRFYQPDIDVNELEVVNYLLLSDSSELPLRLRGLAIVSDTVQATLGITGGVHTCLDAIKASMCGAHGIQMVSALLKNGPEHVRVLREELSAWLEDHEYESLRQMQGSMCLRRCPNPRAFIRGNYMQVLQTWLID